MKKSLHALTAAAALSIFMIGGFTPSESHAQGMREAEAKPEAKKDAKPAAKVDEKVAQGNKLYAEAMAARKDVPATRNGTYQAFKKAKRLFKEAIAANPNDARYYFQLAGTNDTLGRIGETSINTKELEAESRAAYISGSKATLVESREQMIARSFCAAKADQFLQAIKDLESAKMLESSAADPDADFAFGDMSILMSSEAYSRIGSFDNSCATLKGVSAPFHATPMIPLLSARTRFEEGGGTQEVFKLIDEANAAKQQLPFTRGLADSLKAIAMAFPAMTSKSVQPEADLEGALKLMDAAIKKIADPKMARETEAWRGMILEEMGKKDEALAAYIKSKKGGSYHLAVGLLFEKKDGQKQALKLIEEGVNTTFEPEIVMMRSGFRLEAGDIQGAIEDYKEAERRNQWNHARYQSLRVVIPEAVEGLPDGELGPDIKALTAVLSKNQRFRTLATTRAYQMAIYAYVIHDTLKAKDPKNLAIANFKKKTMDWLERGAYAGFLPNADFGQQFPSLAKDKRFKEIEALIKKHTLSK